MIRGEARSASLRFLLRGGTS